MCIHFQKYGIFEYPQTFFRFRTAGEKHICIRKRKNQRDGPVIRAKQESRLSAGILCSAVDTININTAMPVPVTGIQKSADMFGIREAVCCLHSYLQIQAACKKAACVETGAGRCGCQGFTLHPAKSAGIK